MSVGREHRSKKAASSQPNLGGFAGGLSWTADGPIGAGRAAAERSERPERASNVCGSPSAVASTVEALAPDTGNTGATIRQSVPAEGGLDWLEVCAYGMWALRDWPAVMAKFDAAKRLAQSDQPDRGYVTTPDGDHLRMRPNGVKRGTVYCEWVLDWQGVTFYIVNRPSPHDTLPSVCIEIPSLPCMKHGAKEVWEQAQSVLRLLGFEMLREVVSRADPSIDLVGVDVEEFVKPVLARRRIASAKKFTYYEDGLRWTGFDCGRGIHLRIYDKLAESRHDPIKLAVLAEQRWGGVIPEVASRVEFQLRRDELRERWSVSTVADLLAKLPQIVAWLTTEWFRITETDFDRDNRNHGRAVVAKLWTRVCQAFAATVGQATGERIEPRKRLIPNVKQMKLQAMGCLQAAAAVVGKSIDTAAEFADFVAEVGRELAKNGVEGVRRKRELLDVSGCAFIPETDIPF